MTKLIIVEGLPGSGKSTSAKVIYDIIACKGLEVELFYEDDYMHPVDFDGVAFFNDEEFNKLKQGHIAFATILEEFYILRENGRGWSSPVFKFSRFPKSTTSNSEHPTWPF